MIKLLFLLIFSISSFAQTSFTGQIQLSNIAFESGTITGGGGGGGGSSDLPSIPSNATTFSNLQRSSGNPGSWTECDANTSCAAGTPSCVGSASLTFGITGPALSSYGSAKFIDTTNSGSPQGCNVLYYRHLGNSWAADDSSGTNTLAGLTNGFLDLYVYPVPGSNIIGYEFDPDIYVGNNWTAKASLACYASSGGKYNLYDQSGNLPTGGAWASTSHSCDWNTTGANQWHHVQLWITFNQTAHTYTYKTLVVDGTTIISTALSNTVTYNMWNHNSGNTLNIEMQIDRTSTAGTSTGYYDNYKFVVW